LSVSLVGGPCLRLFARAFPQLRVRVRWGDSAWLGACRKHDPDVQRPEGVHPGSSSGLRVGWPLGTGERVCVCVRCPVGSAPVTHLDQECSRRSSRPPSGSLARAVPQKIVGSRSRPTETEDRSRGFPCRIQPLMAHDQGASAVSLVEGRRLPLKSWRLAPDPYLGSAASVRNYPNALLIANGTRSRIT